MSRRGGGGQPAPPPIGVGRLVQRVEGAEDYLGVRIDEIDRGQIPPRVAHAEPRQVPVASRDFEPAPLEADRAVTAALRAIDLGAEGAAEILTARARPADVRAGQIALERCTAELAMHAAVIFQLDPRLGRRVQALEREVGLASSIGSNRPSTWAQKTSCLAFW